MITTKGKSILSKYLASGTSSYASYIGVGCGARPRRVFSASISSTESSTAAAGPGNAKIITSSEYDFQVGDYVKIYNANGSNINSVYLGIWKITEVMNTSSFKFQIGDTTVRTLESLSPSPKVILDFSNKVAMDFEMLRLPIKSRNSFIENGISMIELSAELPTTEIYEISEIGLFSDTSYLASQINNKNISSFSGDLDWVYQKDSSVLNIPFISTPLDAENDIGTIEVEEEVFQANSNNNIFSDNARLLRQERPRYEKTTYFIAGDTSTLVESSGILTPDTVTNHIKTNISGLSWLDKSSPNDEIRLALSLVNKVVGTAAPDELRVMLEFSSEEGSGAETATYRYARFHAILDNTDQDFTTNRYVVLNKKLSELEKSQNFSWSQVAFSKIYVSTIKSGSPTADYYVALDSLKFEYLTSNNPIYGLTGYTIIKNATNSTVTKEENATQSITFKFAVGV
jgi:hypothetical protein